MSARSAMIVAAVALLAACGTSPQTRYFTLSVVPGTVVPGSGPATASVPSPVTVAAVNVPASLDRDSMVRRTGPTTVEVSDRDRWVAPLDSMVRRVLSEDLTTRLPEGAVVLPDSPSPPHTASIVVSIGQFELDPRGKVVLKGSWSVLKDGGMPELRRDVALETSARGGDGSAQAEGMSELLGQLATQIATALGKG